jgi:hypothetical protein
MGWVDLACARRIDKLSGVATMTIKFTEAKARSLTARMNAEAAKGEKSRLLDIVLPNGKMLRDCTGEEIAEIAEALERVAHTSSNRAKMLRFVEGGRHG